MWWTKEEMRFGLVGKFKKKTRMMRWDIYSGEEDSFENKSLNKIDQILGFLIFVLCWKENWKKERGSGENSPLLYHFEIEMKYLSLSIDILPQVPLPNNNKLHFSMREKWKEFIIWLVNSSHRYEWNTTINYKSYFWLVYF